MNLEPSIAPSMPTKLNAEPFSSTPARIAIITAACGGPALRKCIASVNEQDLGDFHHYIVVDGPERAGMVARMIGRTNDHRSILILPQATGGNGYYGHRIYGAIPYLVNSPLVCYLDEDNEYEKNHLSTLAELVTRHNLDWGYSLRSIIDHSGRRLCHDDCDSLGIWGSWYGMQHHIDTNCYMLRRPIAIEISILWHRQGYSASCVDPDKAICRWLLHNRIHGFTTGKYTVRYRLGGSAMSVKLDYFRTGNGIMKSLFKYFPWRDAILGEINDRIDYRRIIARREVGMRPRYRGRSSRTPDHWRHS